MNKMNEMRSKIKSQVKKTDMAKLLLLANKCKEEYVSAVEDCGGEAVVKYVPELDCDYTQEFDGLILCGGNDIHPRHYGEDFNGSVDIDEARDIAEMAVAKQFMQAEKPIFGICRGAQLLNVLLGGTLIQHLPNTDEHRLDRRTETFHSVTAVKGGIFEKLYGETFTINSFHHQAINKLGEGLKASLIAMDGKTIEGVEHTEKPYFGVQYHPERIRLPMDVEGVKDGMECFRYFISLCEKVKNQ